MIKRLISILLITVMLMTSMITYADKTMGQNAMDIIKNQLEVMRLQAQNVQSFVAIMKDLIPLMLKELKDVKESDWFKENLALLYSMKIIEGDGKGHFLPNNEVTGSQFLKMVVVALDNKNYPAVDGKWDKPYIDRAIALGLVKSGEIGNYNTSLNRYQMARIIVRACNEEYDDYNQYQGNIKDYSKIPTEYKEFVLKAYSKGIITGYTDGKFKGDDTMRRSEATAVIARLIDPSQRKMPEKPEVIEIDEIITTDKATLIGTPNGPLGIDGVPTAEGKKVEALAKKYKYSLFSLGDGYYFDYKAVQKDGFLEPVIYVSSDSPESKQWTSFQIINTQEYKGKDYKIKFECVSNPEYNSKLFGGWQDMNKYFDTIGLSMKDTTTKRGDVLKYEIFLTNGTTTKAYPFTVTLGGEVK